MMAGQNRSGSRKQSSKVAFCGMMVALSVALMLTGGLVPIATYCAPMLGGILLLPIMLEYGRKTAWTAYIATSLIVLTLGVDKEAAFFYLFLGYYPIIKWNIEKIGKKPLSLDSLKLVVSQRRDFPDVCDSGLCAPHGCCRWGNLPRWARGFFSLFAVLMNFSLLLYDRLLVPLTAIYINKLRPRLRFPDSLNRDAHALPLLGRAACAFLFM